MSYLVLARKWRPTDFSEMIGQEHVTKTLTNALASGKTAHAYLFHGPRGVGKTTAARIMAKAVNCQEGMGPHPCNTCNSCTAISSGSSLDVVEMDGASNRGIDEIRELKEHVGYAPVSSRFKVYIIDEVHMLTEQAFNALLKTLEEPPPHVVFVFATTEAHKIPATILSRCQRFEFRRIPVSLIVSRLASLAKKEEIEADQNALTLIARRSDGCMRDGESLLDQAAAAAEGTIDESLVRELLGLAPLEALADLLRTVVGGDVADVANQLDAMISEGMEIDRVVADLNELLLRFIRIRAGVHEQESTGSEQQLFHDMTESIGTADLLRYLNVLQNAQSLARQSTRPGPVLESALFRCAMMDRSRSIRELLEFAGKEDAVVSDGSRGVAENKPKIVNQKPPEAETPDPPVENLSHEEIISAVLARVGGSMRALIQCADIQWPDKDTMRLDFPAGDEFGYQSLTRRERKSELETALSTVAGRIIQVEIHRREGTPESDRQDRPKPEEQRIVRAIIDQFDGIVVEKRNRVEEGRSP